MHFYLLAALNIFSMTFPLALVPVDVLQQILNCDGLSEGVLKLWKSGSGYLRSKMTRRGVTRISLTGFSEHTHPLPKCLKMFQLDELKIDAYSPWMSLANAVNPTLQGLFLGLRVLSVSGAHAKAVIYASLCPFAPSTAQGLIIGPQISQEFEEACLLKQREPEPFFPLWPSLEELTLRGIGSSPEAFVVDSRIAPCLPQSLRIFELDTIMKVVDPSHLPRNLERLHLLPSIGPSELLHLSPSITDIGSSLTVPAVLLLLQFPHLLPNLKVLRPDDYDSSLLLIESIEDWIMGAEDRRWPDFIEELCWVRSSAQRLPPLLKSLTLPSLHDMWSWLQINCPSYLTTLKLYEFSWEYVEANFWPETLTDFTLVYSFTRPENFHQFPRSLKKCCFAMKSDTTHSWSFDLALSYGRDSLDGLDLEQWLKQK